MSSETQPPTPKASELSKVPSWMMLGFVIGAMFAFLVRRESSPPPPAPLPDTRTVEIRASPEPAPRPALSETSGSLSLSVVETMWEQWGRYAIWEDDVTEIAVWNTTTQSFKDCYEVMRRGDRVFFRSIPALTRPATDRGTGLNSPLQFTDPTRPMRR